MVVLVVVIRKKSLTLVPRAKEVNNRLKDLVDAPFPAAVLMKRNVTPRGEKQELREEKRYLVPVDSGESRSVLGLLACGTSRECDSVGVILRVNKIVLKF